jgi:hypothetical protein
MIPLTHPITTASGDVIENLFVPKGTLIRLPISGVNRSEALWGPDSGTFDPKRWLVSDGLKGSARREEIQGYKHLLSFAFGPRMCLGRNFALTEFKVSVWRLYFPFVLGCTVLTFRLRHRPSFQSWYATTSSSFPMVPRPRSRVIGRYC